MISLAQQIEEVERELGLRAATYPRLVAAGKLRQSLAAYHAERMRAVLASLEWLKKNEAKIKARLEPAHER